MSYFRTCYKCGKGTMVRYATDKAICSECLDKEEKMDLKDIEAVATLGGKPLYTAEQMKQAYMSGVYYGYEAREIHEELLNSGEAQDEN